MIKLRSYGGKGGGRASVEGENTLRSTQEAEVIELLSEGQIVGFVAPNGEPRVGDDILKSIYLNEIPILNEDGAPNYQNTELEFDYRLGTQSQTPLNGFADAGQRTTFKADNTSEIKAVYPTGISQIINNSDLQIRTIEVILGIPQFYQQNKKTGDTTAVTVALELWLKSGPNGSFVKIQDINLTGKTTSRFQQPYTIQVDGSQPQYTVQVRRVTPDRGGSTEVDPDFTFADSVFLDAYTVIRSQQLSYPNSALTRLRIKSDQFSSIPSRAYLIKGIQVKVPSNYSATATGNRFVGSWDGQFKTEWTDNPAWIYYDLLTNTRYGVGEFISADQINKWALYEIGKYCDELVPDGFGGVERRFSCNIWLTSADDVYSALNSFASIFRGMQFWAAGKLVAQADMPRDPVAHFTQANVIEGQFTYSGTSLKSRHTAAQVVWNDPQDFYRQKVEYVEDQQAVARWGVVTLEITAVGCTSRGQAHRLGKWALYSDQYETETVTFQTSLESAILAPGDVIEIADTNRHFGRYGGRIKSISGNQITLDSTVPNGAYTLYILAEDIAQANRHLAPKLTELTGTVTGNIFTASSSVAGAEPNMVWTVSGNGYEKEQWRILSITEDSPGLVNITALEYWPSKYDYVEEGLRLQPRYGNSGSPGTGNLGPGLDTPTVQGNWYVEYLYYSGPSVLSTGVTVSWTGNSPKYIVSYRRKAIPIVIPGGGTQWVNDVWKTIESDTNSIDIKPIEPAVYDIKIIGVNNAGTMSQPCEAEMTILGKAAPPSDVTNLSVNTGIGGVNLSWSKVQDLDLKHYELRRFKDSGGSWETATVVGENITATTFIDSELLEPGIYTYFVKAVDTSGNYSSNAASASIDISSGAYNIGYLVASSDFGGPILTWTNPNSAFVSIKHVEIFGSLVNNFSIATLLGTTTGERFKAEVEAGATWYFWVRILDRNGNYLPVVGPVSALSLEKALKTARVFLFQWSSVKPNNPTGVQTYTWSTNSLSPYTGSNGWSNTFSTNPGGSSLSLWVAAQTITTEGQNSTSLVNWASPSVSVYRSESSEEGDLVQSVEIKVYKLELTIPAGPTGTGTYTWATGAFTDPSGWTKEVPAPIPGTTLYSASLRLVDSANAVTSPINWVTATVRPEAYNGTNGGSPIIIDLLSEAGIVPALADGTGYVYPTNQIRLYLGDTLITSGITYSYTSSVAGVIANINSSGNVTFSGLWDTDKVEFIFTATYGGVPYSTEYVIVKSKKGDSAVFADLIFENVIVPTNSSGGEYTLPSGNALRLYSGGEQLTTGVTYGIKINASTYDTSQVKNGLTCAINSSGVITLSGASWTSDSVSFELAAQYKGTWYTHRLTVVKAKQGQPGNNPIIIDLLSEAGIVPALADGTGYVYPTNQIRLYLGDTLITSGITYSYTSSVAGVIANINSSGNVTFSGLWDTDKVEFIFTATYGGVPYSTEYVIVKSKKGDSAVFADLIFENVIVPTNSSGGGYTLPSGNALRLYSGGIQLTTGITYRVKTGASTYDTSQNKNGLTCAINSSGVITLSGASWTSDSVSFELAAQYKGTWYTHRLTVVKAKQGQPGTGSPGPQGASYRTAYTRFSNISPISGTITTVGNSSFPTSSQSNSVWGMSIPWYANDPLPSSTTNSLFQTDGVYNPVTNQTTWYTPYLSSLKVGTLSAITTNTGDLTISGVVKSGTANLTFGTEVTYSGYGMYIDEAGNFAAGNSNQNYIWATNSGGIRFRGNIQAGDYSSAIMSFGDSSATKVGPYYSAFHIEKTVANSGVLQFSGVNFKDDTSVGWFHKGIPECTEAECTEDFRATGGNAFTGTFYRGTLTERWSLVGSLASGNTYAAVRGQAFAATTDYSPIGMFGKAGWFAKYSGISYSDRGNKLYEAHLCGKESAAHFHVGSGATAVAQFSRHSEVSIPGSGHDGEEPPVATVSYVYIGGLAYALDTGGTAHDIRSGGTFLAGDFANSAHVGKTIVVGDANGTFALGGVSDERLKNISTEDTNPGLRVLNRFKTITYHWKSDPNKLMHWGFSAQQIKSIAPNLVSTNPNGFLAIKELEIIPMLVKAVQELSAQVEELKKKLNA